MEEHSKFRNIALIAVALLLVGTVLYLLLHAEPSALDETTVERIYLSPSKQPANTYASGNTNEQEQMEAVAVLLRDILSEEYVVDVKLADLTLENHLTTRSEEAEAWNADLYVAIHSNAGNTKNAGACAFYHPNTRTGKTLCEAIVEKLDDVCPIESTLKNKVSNGMLAFDGAGYAEVRNPYNHGMIAALIEVNYHDREDTAEWIIKHKYEIAHAIAEGIAETYHLSKKE